jgi:hypothetical protein
VVEAAPATALAPLPPGARAYTFCAGAGGTLGEIMNGDTGGGGAGGVVVAHHGVPIQRTGGTANPGVNGGGAGYGGSGFGAGGGGGGHWLAVGYDAGGAGVEGFVYLCGTDGANDAHFTCMSGTYTLPATGTVQLLLMGGGGGGGQRGDGTAHGGGGGGGLTTATLRAAAGTVFSIVVGAGGGSNADGGATVVTVNGATYAAAGGAHGGRSECGGAGSSSGGGSFQCGAGRSAGSSAGGGAGGMGAAAFAAALLSVGPPQGAPVSLGAPPRPYAPDGQEERIDYNTWVGQGGAVGLPPQLVGRVQPEVWIEFIRALTYLGEHQQGCLRQCLTCSCDEAAAQFEAGLLNIERCFGPALGVQAFTRKAYGYEVWVPPQPAVEAYRDSEGHHHPGRPAVPGHWKPESIAYLEVTFAQRFEYTPVPMAPPGLAPAGMPSYYEPPQQQMYGAAPGAQQPVMNPLLQPLPGLQPAPYAYPPAAYPEPMQQQQQQPQQPVPVLRPFPSSGQ